VARAALKRTRKDPHGQPPIRDIRALRLSGAPDRETLATGMDSSEKNNTESASNQMTIKQLAYKCAKKDGQKVSSKPFAACPARTRVRVLLIAFYGHSRRHDNFIVISKIR
jgi:hypothetical protein